MDHLALSLTAGFRDQARQAFLCEGVAEPTMYQVTTLARELACVAFKEWIEAINPA